MWSGTKRLMAWVAVSLFSIRWRPKLLRVPLLAVVGSVRRLPRGSDGDVHKCNLGCTSTTRVMPWSLLGSYRPGTKVSRSAAELHAMSFVSASFDNLDFLRCGQGRSNIFTTEVHEAYLVVKNQRVEQILYQTTLTALF